VSWEQLADQLESIKAIQPLWAQWHAYVGSEDYGIWILRPDAPSADQARAKFSLIAARAIQKLRIPPVPVPQPLQHCPHWTDYCRAEEEMARRAGRVRDLSNAVPYGLDKTDGDAVDPCTRAWLELLRRESRDFRASNRSKETLGTAEYQGLGGRIEDLCGTSAAYCRRRQRDEIGARLGSRLEADQATPSSIDHIPVLAIAEEAMADSLAEFFNQFDLEEQAEIKAAEESTKEILARGVAAASDRQRAAGSHDVPDWVQQPQDDARADAVGVVFVAYVNALWRKTDAARAECIHAFLAQIEKLIDPLLTRYGWEGKDLITELRAKCQITVSLVHSYLAKSTKGCAPPWIPQLIHSKAELITPTPKPRMPI
jgi:hypothetical protein